MGFLDSLLSFGAAAGVLAYYRSMYNDYDDEALVDEFYRLWKRRYNYESTDDENIKYQVVKLIIDSRQLFDFSE